VDESTGTPLTRATLGLDVDLRVEWECSDCARLLGRSIVGETLQETFPALPREIDSQSTFSVVAPQRPNLALALSPSRIAGHAGQWFVTIEAIANSQDSKQVVTQLLKVVYEERAALAEILHHGPHQVLAALLIRLGGIEGGADKAEVIRIRELVSNVSSSLRDATTKLAPPRAPGGLSRRLGELARLFRQYLALQVVGPEDHSGLYAPVIESAVFDAVQALLSFAASASIAEASVSIHESATELRVLIELHAYAGDVAVLRQQVECDTFDDAQGELSTELHSDIATVVLRFPLANQVTEDSE
jgi:signal transduction histidine kinase